MSDYLKVISIGMSKDGLLRIGTDKGYIKVKVKSIANVIKNFDRQKKESVEKNWDEADHFIAGRE
jgi:hypothetical protein